MVSFQCDGCSDVVKKPKLDQHRTRCHASFTCIDCSTTFDGPPQYKGHTSCISEAEKYQKSLFKGPKSQQNNRVGPRDNYAERQGGQNNGSTNGQGKYQHPHGSQERRWAQPRFGPRSHATGANETPLGTPVRMSPEDLSPVDSPSAAQVAPSTKEEGVDGKAKDKKRKAVNGAAVELPNKKAKAVEHKDKPEAAKESNSVAEEKLAKQDKKKDKSKSKEKSGEGEKVKKSEKKRKVGKVETESGMESKTKDPVEDGSTEKNSAQVDKVGTDIQVDTTAARGSPPSAVQDIGSTVLAEETGQVRKKTKKSGAEKGKGKKGSAELEKAEEKAEEKTKGEETNSKDKKPRKKAKKEKEAGTEINSEVRGDGVETGGELKKRKREDEVTALDIGKDKRKKKAKSSGDANVEDVKVKSKGKDKEKKKGKSRTEPVSA